MKDNRAFCGVIAVLLLMLAPGIPSAHAAATTSLLMVPANAMLLSPPVQQASGKDGLIVPAEPQTAKRPMVDPPQIVPEASTAPVEETSGNLPVDALAGWMVAGAILAGLVLSAIIMRLTHKSDRCITSLHRLLAPQQRTSRHQQKPRDAGVH